MKCVYVCDNEDGTVIVAPAPDVTPEQLQGGETFKSMDEALQAVGSVLGEPDADDEGAAPDAAQPDPAADTASDGMQAQPEEDDEESAMGGGYKNARRGG